MAKQIGAVQFTGKFGDVVGSKGLKGNNLRVKADRISNPRSDAQCIQRMICATTGVAISYLKEILNNCVEGKATGNATLNYLRSQWMRMLRTENILSSENNYQYLPKGLKSFTANPYLISQGTLRAPKIAVSDFEITIDSMGTPSASILPADLFPTIAVGDQITIINCYYDEEFYDYRVGYCRFAFKNPDVPALVQESGGLYLNPAAIDRSKAEGNWDVLSFGTDKTIGIDYSLAFGYECHAAGLIVSNIEGKKRSTSYMTLNPTRQVGNLAASLCYPTYANNVQDIDLVSRVYLDNSARVNVAEAETPGVVQMGLPIVIASQDNESFEPERMPSQPTDVRFNFVQAGTGLTATTENLVGLEQDAECARFSDIEGDYLRLIAVWNTSSMEGEYTGYTEIYNASSSNAICTGGYVICDGEKYTF